MSDCQNLTYSTKISKLITQEYVSDTLQVLLGQLSIEEQSLPALLIGNMITSALKKQPTPLQIAIGVYLHKKKTIMHMHDYLVSCSYDTLLMPLLKKFQMQYFIIEQPPLIIHHPFQDM